MTTKQFNERTLALYKDFQGMIESYSHDYEWIFRDVIDSFVFNLSDYMESLKAIPVWNRECLRSQKLAEFTANLRLIFEAHVKELESKAKFVAPVISKEDQNILLDKVGSGTKANSLRYNEKTGEFEEA